MKYVATTTTVTLDNWNITAPSSSQTY